MGIVEAPNREVAEATTVSAFNLTESLAHGRLHAVVLEIKRSPRRPGDSP
jgi:hypothetical protein